MTEESPPTANEPPAGEQLPPGTIVADRYRIEARIGEGGMGVVYRAEHVHMRKPYALKVLNPELGAVLADFPVALLLPARSPAWGATADRRAGAA